MTSPLFGRLQGRAKEDRLARRVLIHVVSLFLHEASSKCAHTIARAPLSQRESGGQEQDRGAPAGPSGKGKGAAADGKGAEKGATAPAREVSSAKLPLCHCETDRFLCPSHSLSPRCCAWQVSDGSDSDNEDMRSAALSQKRPQPAGLPAWQAGGKQSSKKRRKANKVLQQAAQRGGF